MPLMRCQVNNRRGWKFGQSGKCYAGQRGKQRALRQGQAMRAAGYRGRNGRS